MRKEQHKQKSDTNSSSKRNRQLGWMKTRWRGVRAAAATEQRNKVRAAVAVQRARVVLRKEVDVTRLTGRVGKLERLRTRRRARSGEEEEESRLRKTMRYLKTLERPEAKKGSHETQDVVDVDDVKVNKEKDESQTGRTAIRGRGRSLGPGTSLSRSGVKMLGMVEFASWDGATSKAAAYQPRRSGWIE